VAKVSIIQYSNVDLMMKLLKVAYSLRKKLSIVFLLLLIKLIALAQPQVENKKDASIKIPDYSNLYYWAAHPWKADPSDSVPAPLRKNYIKDSMVDVFFIHPTTYTKKDFIGWNASINDDELNKKTDYSSILYQASAFNERCRVFSPRYRQAHINAFFIDDSVAKPYFDIAYADVKAAFEYYLSHFNNGRPIIIASHSQGTKHAARLLKEFFEGKELEKKLVCAYIVGMPIPKKYFTDIPVCKDSTETGCFVGWRTYKKGYTPDYIKKENFDAVVINPLTWSVNSDKISSSLNLGGVLKNFNKIVPHVVDAKINKNILWTCKPDVFGKIFFTKKNFHIGDINLFYMNIRENVSQRINAYWKKNNTSL